MKFAIPLFNLVFFLALFDVSSGYAEPSPSDIAKEKIKQTKRHGIPMRAVFPDGREAEIWQAKKQLFDLKLAASPTNNTCSHTPPNCFFYSSYQEFRYMWHWTKHPDPDRIGKPVRYKYDVNESGTGYSIDTVQIFTSSDSNKEPPPYKIQCSSFQWLPKNRRFTAITSESMNYNSETSEDENAIDVVVYNAPFKRIEKNTVRLLQPEVRDNSYRYIQGGLFISSAVTFHIADPDTGHLCETTFQVDLGTAQVKLREFQNLPRKHAPIQTMPPLSQKEVEELSVRLDLDSRKNGVFQ